MFDTFGTRQQPVVLVADEDRNFLLLAEQHLSRSGFAVLTAGSGEEALAAYDRCRPDIVLLDILLPGTNGFDVCSELRRRLGDALVPIIMVTADDDSEDIFRGYQAGATDFLNKPLNWVLLAHRARYLVEAGRALGELRRSRASLANAQRIARLGHFEFDLGNSQARWSDELYSILGLDPGRHPPCQDTFLSRVHPDDHDLVVSAIQSAVDTRKAFSLDHRILLPGGEVRHVRQHGEVMTGSTGAELVTGIVQDVTEHARAMDQIRYLANFDGLTGLSNRRMFKLQLREALRAAESHGQGVGLLFMDLDRFKRINDTLGHTAGDQLLQAIAKRILDRVRSSDSVGRIELDSGSSGVSRLGGDEFTLILPKIGDPSDAGRVAERILQALPPPINVDGHEVSVSASIGIAVHPGDGSDVDTLVRRADSAMYHVKSRGGNDYQFFAESMNETSVQKLTLEAWLRDALPNDELHLEFQPKVSLGTGEVTGMEALARWTHPEIGAIPPAEFIPLAEESGSIIQIGNWVLLEACTRNKAWQDAGLLHVPVAVNISSRQFANRSLHAAVVQSLETSGLDPRYLELEITESAMIEDEEATASTLEQLKALGVQVALDDFGTGFSSLSYVKRFPLDTLKVDKSFVQDLPQDPDAAGIVTAIIAMAHVLSLRVVAEGVETEAQANFLRNLGCDEIQGFLVGRPVGSDQMAHFLDPHRGPAYPTKPGATRS